MSWQSVDSTRTRVSFVTVGNGDLAIINGIGENHDADHAVVLSVLHFESAKQAAVLDQRDLALKRDTKLLQTLVIRDRTKSTHVISVRIAAGLGRMTTQCIRIRPKHGRRPSSRETWAGCPLGRSHRLQEAHPLES